MEHFQNVDSCLQKLLKLCIEQARHRGWVKFWFRIGGCLCSEGMLGRICHVRLSSLAIQRRVDISSHLRSHLLDNFCAKVSITCLQKVG